MPFRKSLNLTLFNDDLERSYKTLIRTSFQVVESVYFSTLMQLNMSECSGSSVCSYKY